MTTKKQNIESAFNQEQNRLTNFIKGRVGSVEDAEDIVQDVFLSFVGAFDDISDLRKSISWLYSVAKNKIVDYRRKKKTYAIESQSSDDDDEEGLSIIDLVPSLETMPDEQMLLDAVWEEIQIRLDELPLEQREVFQWHELDGLSFQQISTITGASINTLISRKRYAVLYLREHLEEMFDLVKE